MNYIPKKRNGKLVLPVAERGQEIIRNPFLNKGSGFSMPERLAFGVEGLVPPHMLSIEEQITQIHDNFIRKENDIEKYIFLRSLQDRNETLFYAFCKKYILEALPIIYTPTVGDAVKKYGHIFRFARGLFITPYNVDKMDEIAASIHPKSIEMIVVTDSQGILGIGDQGVGGMAISIGKLSIYTVAAGFHPSATLPIVLDVGTDNQDLLNDPLYLGLRQKRMCGAEYDRVIETFVAGIKRNFPGAILQWEDFSKQNAFNNMDRYINALPSFNDDIQGTAAVTVGGIFGALKIKNEKISRQKILIYGAGAAGIGIARQILDALIADGLTQAEALSRIFVVDSQGLLLSDRKLDEYKKEFAMSPDVVSDWGGICMQDVIRNAGITILVGVSGQPGSFTDEIIGLMLKNTDEPVIFPLSNPTSLAEADPREILKKTAGRAIVAAGSPFGSVVVNSKTYEIGQGNNAFIFPGVGLGCAAAKAVKIAPSVFTAAARALADAVSTQRLQERSIYPSISELSTVSHKVAVAVYKQCVADGNAANTVPNPEEYIQERMWLPEYPEYVME